MAQENPKAPGRGISSTGQKALSAPSTTVPATATDTSAAAPPIYPRRRSRRLARSDHLAQSRLERHDRGRDPLRLLQHELLAAGRPAHRGLPPADWLQHHLTLGAPDDAEHFLRLEVAHQRVLDGTRVASHHPLRLHRRAPDHLVDPAFRLAAPRAPGPPRAWPAAGSARECRRRAPVPAPHCRRATPRHRARRPAAPLRAAGSAAVPPGRTSASAHFPCFSDSSLSACFPEPLHQVAEFMGRHRPVGRRQRGRGRRQCGSRLVVPHARRPVGHVHERADQVDRQREDGRRVVLGRDLGDRLQVAELDARRLRWRACARPRASVADACSSPCAAITLARRSRSASACRAIARFIWSGRSTSFTSTAETSMPHGVGALVDDPLEHRVDLLPVG